MPLHPGRCLVINNIHWRPLCVEHCSSFPNSLLGSLSKGKGDNNFWHTQELCPEKKMLSLICTGTISYAFLKISIGFLIKAVVLEDYSWIKKSYLHCTETTTTKKKKKKKGGVVLDRNSSMG